MMKNEASDLCRSSILQECRPGRQASRLCFNFISVVRRLIAEALSERLLIIYTHIVSVVVVVGVAAVELSNGASLHIRTAI